MKLELFSLSLYSSLFSGVVHIVDMAFRITGQNNKIYRFSSSDIATVVEYTTLASGPVSQYASQYGPNALTVSQTPLLGQVDVPTNKYDDSWLENWVNTLAQQYNIPSTDCICILNPPPMVNTSAALSDGVGGFHQMAHCSYMFVNVKGVGLTLDDKAFRYATTLSHELVEMVVDPQADISNPEVCDPCARNCGYLSLNCFTRTGEYVGSVTQAVKDAAIGFPYDFFVAGVVQPDFVNECPAPAVTCTYWPEIWSALGGPNLQQIVAADRKGSLEIFGLGNDGAVYHLIQTLKLWSGWTSLLGHGLRQISVAGNDDGRLEIFAVGGDRLLYHIWQTPPNDVWGQWEGLGGKDVHEIAVLLDASRRFVLFSLDGAGAVSVISQVGPNGLWGNWQPLQGHDLKQITAAVNSQKQLLLLALGADGAAYFRQRDAAGVWTAWGGIPGTNLSQISVATDAARGLVLFGTGTDKSAWASVQGPEGGAWGSWMQLNGSQLKSVIAAPNDNGCLDLFAIGGNSRAYHITQQLPNYTWGDWAGLGATQRLEFQQVVPILKLNRELEVFGLSSTGRVFHISQRAKNGGWS